MPVAAPLSSKILNRNTMKTTTVVLLTLVSLLVFAACGGDGDDIVIERKPQPVTPDASASNSNRNTTGGTEAQTRLEFPRLKNNGSVVVVHRAQLNKTQEGVNYCVEWDPAINAQRWSCYQMYSTVNYHSSYNVARYKANNDGSLSPQCQYPNDADLPVAYQMTADPYKYNGYDHGHICPSADRLRSSESNYQTFYITNMQPQLKVFNSGIWDSIENQVRTWASLCDTLFVCKGGTIDKDEHIIKYITDHVTGKNKIPVPRYFFTAMLAKKGTTYKALGLWVEQLNEDHRRDALKDYVVSIDQLEELTGIDFFCNLPDETEVIVEATLTLNDWNLK